VTVDISLQVDLAVRLLLSAVLGSLIGLEREIHHHPAGMRTHLLVALGAAAFTVLSATAFGAALGADGSANVDPTRIAAQVVSGIGFLGAGAILKYGSSIRGLTTAASLWVTAAIGMAAGASAYGVAIVGTFIAIFSLWPLQAVVRRLEIGSEHSARVRLRVGQLGQLGRVTDELTSRDVEIDDIESRRSSSGSYDLELVLRLPSGMTPSQVLVVIGEVPEVEVLQTGRADRE
jgi:putative Mg2+ transporter-C (MgtC) family protein